MRLVEVFKNMVEVPKYRETEIHSIGDARCNKSGWRTLYWHWLG